MGFYMNRIVFLTAAIAIVTASGCIKDPKEKNKTKDDFGPEATREQMIDALNSVPSPTVLDLRVGDFAMIEHKQYIENQRPMTASTMSSTIQNRTESDEELSFEYVTQMQEYANGQPKPTPPLTLSNRDRYLKKPKQAMSGWLNSLLAVFSLRISAISESKASDYENDVPQLNQYNLFEQHSLKAFGISPAAEVNRTFHNLSVTPIDLEVPEMAKMRTNCGGRTADRCSRPIKAVRLQYDIVVWNDDGTTNKFSVRHVASEEAPIFGFSKNGKPFLTSFLLECTEGIVAIPSQKVHLIDCDEVRDFIMNPL